MTLVFAIIGLLCLLGFIVIIPLQIWWKSPVTKKTFSFWHVVRLYLWIGFLACGFVVKIIEEQNYYSFEQRIQRLKERAMKKHEDNQFKDYDIYKQYMSPRYCDGGLVINDFPCAPDLSAPKKFWNCKGVKDGKYVDTAVKLYYEGIHGHLRIEERGDEIFVMIRDDARGWVEVDRID